MNHAMFKDTHIRKSFSEIVQVNSIYPQTGQNIMRMYIDIHTNL